MGFCLRTTDTWSELNTRDCRKYLKQINEKVGGNEEDNSHDNNIHDRIRNLIFKFMCRLNKSDNALIKALMASSVV